MGRTGGEGAKFWLSVLTDLRERGVKDTFFVAQDPGNFQPLDRDPGLCQGRPRDTDDMVLLRLDRR